MKKSDKNSNPALNIKDFSSFALKIVNEIDFARMHPNEFCEKLKTLKNSIVNKGNNTNSLLIQGIPFTYINLLESLDDAIDFMENQEELEGVIYNECMSLACDDLLNVIKMRDGINENELDDQKYTLEKRLKKYGDPFGEIYELIDYGMFDPDFIVINFILGDGDPNKIDRSILFNPDIKTIGIGAGLLPSDRVCTIINFAEEFFEIGKPISLDIQLKYQKNPSWYNTQTYTSYSEPSDNKVSYSGSTIDPNKMEKEREVNILRKKSGELYKIKKKNFINNNNLGNNIPYDIGSFKIMNIEENEKNLNNIKNTNEENEVEFNEEEWPEGATNVDKTEKIITESDGTKVILEKKIITFSDGTVKTEVKKKYM